MFQVYIGRKAPDRAFRCKSSQTASRFAAGFPLQSRLHGRAGRDAAGQPLARPGAERGRPRFSRLYIFKRQPPFAAAAFLPEDRKKQCGL
jgi:hypothetical protein